MGFVTTSDGTQIFYKDWGWDSRPGPRPNRHGCARKAGVGVRRPAVGGRRHGSHHPRLPGQGAGVA